MNEKKKEVNQSKFSIWASTFRTELTMGAVLILLIIVLRIISKNFLTARNMTNILSDRKSTRLNSGHPTTSRMPSSA